MKKTVRVGVFDSGIGGLTVLSECVKVLPEAEYFYFGDNRHAPYGSRPPAEITAFVRSALRRFQRLGVHAAVLACNTATATSAEEMRREFPFPVVGMEPAVKPAAKACKNVLVLCTPRTAESARLKGLIEGCPGSKFTVYPASGLAGAIEYSLINGQAFSLAEHLPKGGFDGVVLGCTHYVFFRREISAFYRAPTFDGNEGAARRLKSLFAGSGVEPEWSESTKINKSSRLFWRGKGDFDPIFLGSTAKYNQKIYEQTFPSGLLPNKEG